MTDTDQINAIAAQLRHYVSDPNDTYNVTAGDAGFVFWGLKLTNDQVTNVSKTAGVAAVYDDCADKCTLDLTTTTVFDQLTPLVGPVDILPRTQLAYLSWPPETLNPAPDLTKYWFDDSAGSDVPVYFLETGASLGHEEFTRSANRVRWLPDGVTQGDGWNWHGTFMALEPPHSEPLSVLTYNSIAMLGTVAGTRLGVAKNVNPVIVRLGASHPTSPFSHSEWVSGLAEVNADLGANSDVTTAIVLLATEIPRTAFTTNGAQGDALPFQIQLWNIMKSMVEKGAIPVTGSGNLGSPTIDAWPQNFGKPHLPVFYIPELLVMGAISGDGLDRMGKQSC